MSKQLILIKHSLPEIKKDFPARDWRLSEAGRIRVERLAESVIPYRPERLFSSPEPKAMETAGILEKRFLFPTHVIHDLHEHERSNAAYLSDLEFNAAVEEFFEKPDALVFGSETANEAYERFSRVVNSILAGNENYIPAIVSH